MFYKQPEAKVAEGFHVYIWQENLVCETPVLFCCFCLPLMFNKQNKNPPSHLAELFNFFQITTFCFSFLPVFSWKSQGLFHESHRASLNFNLPLVSAPKWTGGISPFSHPPVEQSMHTHLAPAAAFILPASAWLTTIPITDDFFNRTYYIYLTSSLQKKAREQTGWEFFCQNFLPQTHAQTEIIALQKFQPLGFRISQTEQNILFQFSQRKIETKFLIFLKLKHFWFSSQSELFCLAPVQCWSVCLWSYSCSPEQQAGCVWRIFLVLGRASCLDHWF